MSIPSGESASPFWAPDRHRDRRPRLLARARAVTAIRAHFASEGFLEVEPAALQASPGNETHLHGFATEIVGGDGARHAAFLHTSPEFAMKKLLAAGETRIFAFAKVFRNRERGALHAPEFTMLEWYRVGEPPAAIERDCAALMRISAQAGRNAAVRFPQARVGSVRGAGAGFGTRGVPEALRDRHIRDAAARRIEPFSPCGRRSPKGG